MVEFRPYRHAEDFEAVSRFLIDTYQPGNVFTNWLQPRWEYMHAHSYIARVRVEDFGIAEDEGNIVGVVHCEHSPTTAYFELRPGHEAIKAAMVDYAEKHFGGWSQRLLREVRGLYINDFDEALATIADERSYRPQDDGFAEVNARFVIDRQVPVPPLPKGFRLAALDEENDLSKIHRVLWRGFGHDGPPPPEGVADRLSMQQSPGFRKDLTMVAVAPNGDYAAFGGMWYVPANRVAYVEPVATDPDYRRLGLGTAVVLETIRRVAALGATVAWVGSDQDFYKAMGFEVMFRSNLWLKELDP